MLDKFKVITEQENMLHVREISYSKIVGFFRHRFCNLRMLKEFYNLTFWNFNIKVFKNTYISRWLRV